MARPRPSPPCRRVLLLSACRKLSKTCGSIPGSMPWPVSLTVTRAQGVVPVEADVDVSALAG